MFAGFLSPKQDPRSLKVEAARVRTILSEKRIAEILYEAFDEILLDGIADARVLLVHVDEPGGHERAHVVGDRGGRQADAVEKKRRWGSVEFGLKRRLVGLNDGVQRASSCWYRSK